MPHHAPEQSLDLPFLGTERDGHHAIPERLGKSRWRAEQTHVSASRHKTPTRPEGQTDLPFEKPKPVPVPAPAKETTTPEDAAAEAERLRRVAEEREEDRDDAGAYHQKDAAKWKGTRRK